MLLSTTLSSLQTQSPSLLLGGNYQKSKQTLTRNNSSSEALTGLLKRAFAACLHRARFLNSDFPREELGLRFPSPSLFFSLLSPN